MGRGLQRQVCLLHRKGGRLFSVFDGAAVGTGFLDFDGFAFEQLVECHGHVVFGFADIGRVGAADAVDGTSVLDALLGSNHEHVWRGAGPVASTDFATGVQQHGCCVGFFLLLLGFGLFGGAVSLAAFGRRDNRQPDDTFFGVFGLKLLHVSVSVVLFDEWTTVVEPF